jgi:hypothetical protein
MLGNLLQQKRRLSISSHRCQQVPQQLRAGDIPPKPDRLRAGAARQTQRAGHKNIVIKSTPTKIDRNFGYYICAPGIPY